MGKRKRGRSVRRNVQIQNKEPEELLQAPHSFVIHRGLPGGYTLELTKDFRRVMEPFTATSLKERKKNTIKDFVSIASVFHVSHLCIFSRTDLGLYMKMARLPRGPTLTFRIHSFCLARDVISSLKKQLVFDEAFKHSPLIVLNNFSGEGMQMKLMASMFQNLFPTINLSSINLSNLRRCVLLNYNSTSKLIDFRHYVIKVVPVGVSKVVKKVVLGKVPNLSHCNDISELISKAGVLSESEAEDDPNSQVELAQKLSSRGNLKTGKSAIRLSEVGPRITMQLIKVEDGLLDGEVLYHELVTKTEEEVAVLKKKRDEKMKLKLYRRKVQEDNKKKKDEKKIEHKEKSLKGMKKNTEDPKSDKEQKEMDKPEDDDDVEYYRQEVGAEPDEDLFSGAKKRTHSMDFKKNKRMKGDDTEHGFNKHKKMKLGNDRSTDRNFSKNRKMKSDNDRSMDRNFSRNRKMKSDNDRPMSRNFNKNKKMKSDNTDKFKGKRGGFKRKPGENKIGKKVIRNSHHKLNAKKTKKFKHKRK